MGINRRESRAGQRLLLGVLAGITMTVTGVIGTAVARGETVAANFVRTVETGSWTPPGGDPSGIVQVGDRLIVVDSEVDENDDACYGGSVNMWEVSLDDPTQVLDTASLPTREPSGVGYDPINEILFVSDDENVGDGNKIWVVSYDDPSTPLATIELGDLENAVDVEDPAFNPATGELFVAGIVELPGSGEYEVVVFRITASTPDFSSGVSVVPVQVGHIVQDELEGLAIDPNTGNLLLGAKNQKLIYEVDPDDLGGPAVRIIDASNVIVRQPSSRLQYISGLAAVDVGGETHYWVTDRRSDCGAMDGLLVELTLGEVTNRPPSLDPIPDKTVVAGQTLTFTATASDPDPGQSLTFSLVGAPTGATIHPATGAFSWVASGSGPLEFTVRVTDNGTPQLSAQRVVRVSVTQPNRAPTLNAIGDKQVVEGQTLAFVAKATDPDGHDLTFSLNGQPAGAGIDATTGEFSWLAQGEGEIEFTVIVTDNGVPPLTDQEEITVTVLPASDPGDPGDPGTPGDPGVPGDPPKGPDDPPNGPSDPGDPGGPSQPAGPVGSFVDDDDHVFESDIEWLATRDITRGCNPPTNTLFCPDDFVTRGQMAAFLVRALGLTVDDPGDQFVDDDGHVFESDIERLASAGVTRGCNPPANDRFCPDDFVTRGQMAAFLRRAIGD